MPVITMNTSSASFISKGRHYRDDNDAINYIYLFLPLASFCCLVVYIILIQTCPFRSQNVELIVYANKLYMLIHIFLFSLLVGLDSAV